jgi:hypothetical protein
MRTEEWRSVPGYEGVYEVSNLGRVASCFRQTPCSRHGTRTYPRRVLKLRPTSGGYVRAGLAYGGTTRTLLVHRLVAMAFLGPPPEGMEVCHNNGQRADNRATNLRWDTRVNNHADMAAHGTAMRGERQHQAKLTEDKVRHIRRSYAEGVSRAALAKQHGVAWSTIQAVTARRNWRHVE